MACTKAFALAPEKSVGWMIVFIGNCVTKRDPRCMQSTTSECARLDIDQERSSLVAGMSELAHKAAVAVGRGGEYCGPTADVNARV
jgi:hypothetical protein